MMIETGSDILFQEPTCDTRRLRRSVVVEASPDEFSIQFVADPFAFEKDQEVRMCLSGKRESMQQIGRTIESESEPDSESDVVRSTVID